MLVTVAEASAKLTALIEAACKGEDVVISDAQESSVRLVPITEPAERRVLGAARGKTKVTSEFFQPFSEAEF